MKLASERIFQDGRERTMERGCILYIDKRQVREFPIENLLKHFSSPIDIILSQNPDPRRVNLVAALCRTFDL